MMRVSVSRLLAVAARQPGQGLDNQLLELLGSAVNKGHATFVRAFVRAVTIAPVETMDPRRRLALLLSLSPRSRETRWQSAPGQAAQAVSKSCFVLALPSLREEPEQLECDLPSDLESESDSDAEIELQREAESAMTSASTSYLGKPMLSRLCSGASEVGPEVIDQLPQYRALHAYVNEVVNSPALSEAERETICASIHANPDGQFTAAELALKGGKPGAVGMMMCAILESHVRPAFKITLLQRLGVSTQEVLAALRETHPDRQGWPQQLTARIRVGHTALQLMEGDGLVTLSMGNDAHDKRCRDAGLRTERLLLSEFGIGRLICSAELEIENLGRREAAERKYWYAIDPNRLKAGSSPPK